MLINNVAAGYSDSATVAKRGDQVQAAARGVLKATDASAPPSNGSRAALGQILAQYDIKNISPTQFSEMVQKLHQAGSITDGDFQELTAIRSDLDSANVAPDEKIDLTEFYARKVKQAQNNGDDPNAATNQQQLGPLLRRYDWVQKFAVMQSNPQAAGIDAVA
jgi:hypothetical protein